MISGVNCFPVLQYISHINFAICYLSFLYDLYKFKWLQASNLLDTTTENEGSLTKIAFFLLFFLSLFHSFGSPDSVRWLNIKRSRIKSRLQFKLVNYSTTINICNAVYKWCYNWSSLVKVKQHLALMVIQQS